MDSNKALELAKAAYPNDENLRVAYMLGVDRGYELHREDMLKDAFMDNDVVHDGRIELEGDPLPSLDPILILPYPQFEPGDKVKVIVLKDNEDESK